MFIKQGEYKQHLVKRILYFLKQFKNFIIFTNLFTLLQ